MGFGSNRLIRPLVGEMISAIEEQKVSEEKMQPSTVNGQQSHFICATSKCTGTLSEAAIARQQRDPRFKPLLCTACFLKGDIGHTTPNISEPIVMQVSTATPRLNSKAGSNMVGKGDKSRPKEGRQSWPESQRWKRGM